MKSGDKPITMDIQFVRLDDDICGTLNRKALDQRRTVSDLVNEILRDQLRKGASAPPAENAASA